MRIFIEKFEVKFQLFADFFLARGYNTSVIMLKNIFLIIAKILSVLLVLWWTIFVLLSHGFTLVSLIESVVPLIVLVVTIIAWRWNLIGGLLFVLLGIFYIYMAWGRMPLSVYFFVSGPVILTGILFILANTEIKIRNSNFEIRNNIK